MIRRVADRLFDEGFLARLERLHLIGKQLAFRGSPGQRRSRRLGDGLEFADHRDYAPGDDIRFVDWPYYARMEKLLLRLFHEHGEGDVAILLDASASMAPGGQADKFDHARRAAAAIAYVAMGSLERVSCVPFAETTAPAIHTGRHRGRTFELLEFLASLVPAGRTDQAGCVDQFVRRHAPKGTVMILSDLLDCAGVLSTCLARLRYVGCDAVVLHVYAPADVSPPLHGAVLLHQAETDELMNLHVTEDLLAGYRRRWDNFRRGCERACLSRGTIYVAAPTNLPFEDLVLRALRQAGVLAE